MSITSEPTTQDIKDAFVWVDGYPFAGHVSPELEMLFDSWLAEHDRQVALSARQRAADDIEQVLAGFVHEGKYTRATWAVGFLRGMAPIDLLGGTE